jgi:hypothetical protein
MDKILTQLDEIMQRMNQFDLRLSALEKSSKQQSATDSLEVVEDDLKF